MKKQTMFILGVAIVFLVLALFWPKQVDGFQSNELPQGNVTIEDFVIYSSLNTIIDKLPFVHSNFSSVNSYNTADLTVTNRMVNQVPTGTPALKQDLRTLVNSDSNIKLWSFKLKQQIVGPLSQSDIDALKDASSQLFGNPNKIAFKTSTGRLFPSIEPDAAVVNASAAAAAPTNGYYKSADTTDTNLYYVSTTTGTTSKMVVPASSVCEGKTIPTYANTTATLTATQLSSYTTVATFSCSSLP